MKTNNKQLIAQYIEIQQWCAIIKCLKKEGGKLQANKMTYNKGIDYDQYVLKQKDEKIVFTWDNWFEGEIECNKFKIKFKYSVWSKTDTK